MILLKFYKNKATKFHPSLEISFDSTHWKNLEVTKNPTKTGKYIKVKNVNPNDKKNKYSYIRKYIRNDKIGTRGELLKNYKLHDDDYILILNYLKSNAKNKKS